MTRSLIAIAALIFALPVKANFIDGNTLADICSYTQDNPYKVGNCTGYVMAIADVMERDHWRTTGGFDGGEGCLPPKADAKQLEKVVVKWLDENPSRLHFPAQYLIYNALIEGFGCNDSVRFPMLLKMWSAHRAGVSTEQSMTASVFSANEHKLSNRMIRNLS